MNAGCRSSLLLASVLAAGMASFAWAQLAEDSPFLAEGATPAVGDAAAARHFELRGIMSTADGTRYCIYDPARRTSAWVALGEKGYPFVLTSADPARDQVSLRTDGGSIFSLPLRSSKVSPLRGPFGSNQVYALQQPSSAGDYAGLTPEQSEQEQRMAILREQMARKRMEHLQALKAGLPPVPSQS